MNLIFRMKRNADLRTLRTIIVGVLWPSMILLVACIYMYYFVIAICNDEARNFLIIWRAVMGPPPIPMGPENITKPPTLFEKLWAAFNQDQEPVNVTLFGLALLDLLDLIKNVIALTAHIVALFIVFCAVCYAVSIFRFRCRRFTESKHLVAPGKYDGNTSFDSFLQSLERFLDSQPKIDAVQRCEALRSRINSGANAFIDDSFLSRQLQGFAEDYSTVRDLASTFYGGNKTYDEVSQMSEFTDRLQHSSETPYQYLAVLNRLGLQSFPRLGKDDLEHIIAQRYIRGLNDVELRKALKNHYAPKDSVNGNLYELTKRFENVTMISQVGVHSARVRNCPCVAARSLVKDARITIRCDACHPPQSEPTNTQKQTIVSEALSLADQRACYACHMPGHLRAQCPQKTDRGRVRAMSASVVRHHKASQLSCDPLRGLRELRGSCRINGVYCDFLTDTGAQRTIVQKKLIPEEMWYTILPTTLTMVMAAGAEVPLFGELDCNIELGGTLTQCRILVTDDLNATCLLGMDVLTKCPLTREPIRLLYNAVRSGLSTEVSDAVLSLKDNVNQVPCYRTQVLTLGELDRLRQDDMCHVLVSMSKPSDYSRDENRSQHGDFDNVYEFSKSELPNKAYHDIFQVVDVPSAPVQSLPQ